MANRDRVVIYYCQAKYMPRRGDPRSHLRHDGREGALRDSPRARHGLYGHFGTRTSSKLIPARRRSAVHARECARESRPLPDLRAQQGSARSSSISTRPKKLAELLTLATLRRVHTRNGGMHAVGVSYRAGQVTDFCPRYSSPQRQRCAPVRQGRVEAIGLVKFELPWPATLTISLAREDYNRPRDGRSTRTSTTTSCRSTYKRVYKAVCSR